MAKRVSKAKKSPPALSPRMTALSKLTPYRKNPRVIPDKAVKAVAASLKRFGWKQAIVADPKGVIVAGETRYKAAVSLGWKTAPVVTIPARQARAFRVIDNRTSELTSWDTDLLPDALAGLGDMDVFSFDDVLLVTETAGKTDQDDIPETPKKPITRKGNIWALGRHRIACGVSETDFVRLMPADDVKGGIVLTDPPYGISIVKAGRMRPPGGKGGKVKIAGSIGGAKPFGAGVKGKVGVPGVVAPRLYSPMKGDDKPFDPAWVLTLGAAQIIFGAQFFASRLIDRTAWLCWDKGISDKATFSAFELAWTSFTGRTRMYRHRWSGMVREGDRKTELKDRVHPTQKPVGLFEQILEDVAKKYSIVLDPYAGSGSTLIACEKTGRTCYAVETSRAYCDVIVKRWEDFTGQKAQCNRQRHGR